MQLLRELQSGFLRSVFSRDNADFSKHLVAGRLVGDQAMEIYRNNVFGCLTQALEATYPVILQLAGKGFFKRMATEFICQHPSTCGDLHQFGRNFAQFLSHFPPAAELAYLPDIARLEWLCHEVFYEADCESLDISSLASVPSRSYEDLKLKLHPATRLFSSNFPANTIWEVNQPGHCGDQTVNLEIGRCRLLGKRTGHRVELQALTDGVWALLRGIVSGMKFGDICEVTLQANPLTDINNIVRELVAQSLIVDFTLPHKY